MRYFLTMDKTCDKVTGRYMVGLWAAISDDIGVPMMSDAGTFEAQYTQMFEILGDSPVEINPGQRIEVNITKALEFSHKPIQYGIVDVKCEPYQEVM